MSDLFSQPTIPVEKQLPNVPLAARMRPRTLDEVVGQGHILGPGKLLRRAIESDRITSLIFFGPPGTGKTSLANVIAASTGSRFETLNGVESNVAEIRDKIAAAKMNQDLRGESTILFIDEIHRFNKSQQDVLLPHLERGTVRFIGATTHNPYYYINSPLVSRSQVFQLEPIAEAEILSLLKTALADSERGLGKVTITYEDKALAHLAKLADGDARKALTALELATVSAGEMVHITMEIAEESIQRKAVHYGAVDQFDTISAYIKSIRGSDPDAALYWLAKMLHVGEDPRFISRRLVIAASEDIGLADSAAIRVALDAHHALKFVGMPEGRIPLAHATVYLATSPKSNSAYAGLAAATKDIEEGKSLPVPEHLRTPSSKKLTGKPPSETEYLYSHDFAEGYVPQAYLSEGRRYYFPTDNGVEKRIKERLEYWAKKNPEL